MAKPSGGEKLPVCNLHRLTREREELRSQQMGDLRGQRIGSRLPSVKFF